MNNDWQVGDLALCIDARTPTIDGFIPTGLVEGFVYSVFGIGRDLAGDLGLFLDEVDSQGHGGGYLADRFRKIHPHTPDAEDQETIELLTRRRIPVEA